MAGRRMIDLAGQTLGEWLVLDEWRIRQAPHSKLTEWKCQCSCGAIHWRLSANLRNGLSTHCKSKNHGDPYVIGDTLGKFTIEAFPDERRCHLRCVCGRLREVAKTSLNGLLQYRSSCGCNGVDTIMLRGDPDLPTGVHGYNQLIRWAGCSRQAHYQMIHTRGLWYAVQHLSELAEERHPGEGWRILKVVPMPKEQAQVA